MRDLILVIHGPNLNLLGEREPEIYGKLSLAALNRSIRREFPGVAFKFFQSNHEGAIIDCLHAHRRSVRGVVINPGAFTHYSYAIRDAIAAIASVGVPSVEVHLSDLRKREAFRRRSVLKEVCVAQISGLGPRSYLEGVRRLLPRVIGKAGAPRK